MRRLLSLLQTPGSDYRSNSTCWRKGVWVKGKAHELLFTFESFFGIKFAGLLQRGRTAAGQGLRRERGDRPNFFK
jgi:hypothetical protein